MHASSRLASSLSLASAAAMLLLLVTLTAHATAPEPDHADPEHPAAVAVLPGDRVEIADDAGVAHPAVIRAVLPDLRAVRVEIGGQLYTFPWENVRRILPAEPAGFWARASAWWNGERMTAVRYAVYTVGGLVAGVVGVGAVENSSIRTSSPKDDTADRIAAAEQAAEQATLENGPSVPVRYRISETFSAPPESGFTGEWTPSITFGAQASYRGGAIAAFTLPPRAAGEAPQVVENVGAWSTTAEGEILIEGTVPSYDGRASLAGAPEPGASASRSVVLRTRSGRNLSGGSVAAFEVEP